MTQGLLVGGVAQCAEDSGSFRVDAGVDLLAGFRGGEPGSEPDGDLVERVPAPHHSVTLLTRAPRLLDGWEEARSAALAGSATLTGTVRLAVFQSAYLAVIPDVLTQLHTHHPGLELHIIQAEPGQAIPALLARELDAAVVEQYPGISVPRLRELTRRPLLTDPMLLALPPAHAAREASLADLSDLPWIMDARGSTARAWAEATCRAAGFKPDVRYETGDILIQLKMVRQNAAAAFIPALMPARFTSAVTTTALPDQHRTIHVLHRSSTTDPAVAALHHTLVACLERHP